MSHNEGYARCKACDKQFYPKWIDETKPCGTRVQMFEELCWKCLGIAERTTRDHPMFRGDAYMNKEEYTEYIEDQRLIRNATNKSEDQTFIEGYVMDKQLDRVDYNDPDFNDNRYYENGGGFGDVGLFDSYE